MKLNEKLTKNIFVIPLTLLCCFLWGSAFPCIKTGYKLYEISSDDSASQLLFAGIRFTLAGIMVIAINSLFSKKIILPEKKNIGIVMKVSLFQTILQYLFFYLGTARTSGVNSSIIVASNVFFSMIFSTLIFHQEKLRINKIAGCILGFAGVVIIIAGGGKISSVMSMKGEGFVLISAVSSSLSTVLMKKYSSKANPVMISGYQFFFGGIIMAVFGLLFGGKITHITFSGIILLFYLAVISSVAYTLWGVLLKYNPVSKIVVMGFMNPVFGVLLSAIFLGENKEAFGIYGIAALLLVCIGIFLVNKEFKKEH